MCKKLKIIILSCISKKPNAVDTQMTHAVPVKNRAHKIEVWGKYEGQPPALERPIKSDAYAIGFRFYAYEWQHVLI
jgi:hypothetical protein